MRGSMVVGTVAALAWMVVAAPPASAGGWAMSSLDPMTVPVAGEETEIGFTIRQHGVTPVNPDAEAGTEPVAVAIWPAPGATGGKTVFPARQDGPVGHYVATVTFPAAGDVRWEIRQGWFGAQDLGTIAVTPPGGGGTSAASPPAAPNTTDVGTGTTTEHRWPATARGAAVALAVAAAGVALADAWHARRRGRRPADAVPL
jgi:hypothetical protein